MTSTCSQKDIGEQRLSLDEVSPEGRGTVTYNLLARKFVQNLLCIAVASRFVWKFGAALPALLADTLWRRTTIVDLCHSGQ